MTTAKAVLPLVCVLVPVLVSGADIGLRQSIVADTPQETQSWAARIDTLVAQGDLQLRAAQRDEEFAGCRFERLTQLVQGVPVYGAELVRRVDAYGSTVAVSGRLSDVTTDVRPAALSADQAARALATRCPPGTSIRSTPQLVLLPLDGQLVLTYTLWTRSMSPPSLRRYFLDANTGETLLSYEELETNSAVGLGIGTWADRKKMSADSVGSVYEALDLLRPARITTYDMRFDSRSYDLGLWSPYVATSPNNNWTDGAVVDAHTYIGYTYDYYYDRLGRHGIDGRDMPIIGFIHVLANYVNAFWDPDTRTITFGDGGFDSGGVYMPLSASLDVVAHELTHGVTQSTWNGNYLGESGALNEAFSDIMGTSVEFYIQPPGNGREMADYWLGEDLTTVFAPGPPERLAFRSMDNPGIFGDPDHYSRRYLGTADSGGVHTNSGIANQAFYLLIEGGTNRTSGLKVTGLGSANRAKAEKIFYRGFTGYLTPTATFSDARRATIRAAQELYGVGGVEALQTAAAWDAVGVF